MIRRAFQFVRGIMPHWILANLLMTIGSVCGVWTPTLLGRLLDAPANALSTGLILLLVLCTGTAAGYGQSRLMGWMGNRIATRLRMAVSEKLLRVPQSFFLRHSSGELLSISGNDVNLFQNALSGGMTYVFNTLLSLIMVLFFMIRLDALMTLLLVASLGCIFGANLLLTRNVTGISARMQNYLAEINVLFSQSILGNQELRAYRMEAIGLSIMGHVNDQWERISFRLDRMRARSSLIVGLLSALQLAGLILLGVHRMHAGILTAGSLASFILYAHSVSGPLSSAASLVVDIRRAMAAIRRVLDILDEPEPAAGQLSLPQPPKGHIQIDNLSFSYPSSQPDTVLRNICLTIPAGSTAALVGESGSGKTTLLKILAGFLPVGQGEVYIDGVPMTQLDPASLHDAIAIVSQQPYLFQRSIRDNIAFGRPDATMDEIIQAAKLACAHEFILRLPHGYDTICGENGASLSGGQRQRIAIARAFLKNAPILLLDEATSALDNRTEAQIQAALDRLMQGRTTLIIAHRLSTVRHADCIYYLQNGSILDGGSHEELLLHCPEYHALYERSHLAE